MKSLLKFPFHEEAWTLRSLSCSCSLVLYPRMAVSAEHFLLPERSHERQFSLWPCTQALSSVNTGREFSLILIHPIFSVSVFLWPCLHLSDTCRLTSVIFLSLLQLISKHNLIFINQTHTEWSDRVTTLRGLWFYSVWQWDGKILAATFRLYLSQVGLCNAHWEWHELFAIHIGCQKVTCKLSPCITPEPFCIWFWVSFGVIFSWMSVAYIISVLLCYFLATLLITVGATG